MKTEKLIARTARENKKAIMATANDPEVDKLTEKLEENSLEEKESEKETGVENLTEKKALGLCRDTKDPGTIIALSKHESANVRRNAIRSTVAIGLPAFWDRVFEMRHDEDSKVRYQALHNLLNEGPADMKLKIVGALDEFNRDSDPKIRRAAHKALTSYHRKGKWSLMQ